MLTVTNMAMVRFTEVTASKLNVVGTGTDENYVRTWTTKMCNYSWYPTSCILETHKSTDVKFRAFVVNPSCITQLS